MTRLTFRLLACAAVLAAPLAFTTPVMANDVDNEIQAAEPAHGTKAHAQWEQLHAERAQLIAEHDRMFERCMNVKGQDKTACDMKSDDLNARYENWRQRMAAFSAQCGTKHEGKGHGPKGMKHEHKADAKAPAAPTANGKMMHHHHHHHDMKSQNAAPTGDTSGQ
jgi:hypothetical protein